MAWDKMPDWSHSIGKTLTYLDRYARAPGRKGDEQRDVHVVGVSHVNEDGVSRQDVIDGLECGDTLFLLREPTNPYDPNAIAVVTRGFRQVGYLSRLDAARYRAILDEGEGVIASIGGMSDRTPDKPERGVWLDIRELHVKREYAAGTS